MSEPARPGTLPPWQVLFVDDNPACRRMLEVFLGRAAPTWEVRTVASIAEATALLAQWQPNIILLDLTLQATTGDATLMQMTKVAPNIPVVVVSGSAPADPEIGLGGIGRVNKMLLVQNTPRFVDFLLECALFWYSLDDSGDDPASLEEEHGRAAHEE